MGRTTHPPLTAVRARQQMKNSSFTGPAGQMGAGDRGAFSYIPQYTGNPYDSNDYVYRWRQYVHLYETSWEARKIVRIIPEDALRKDWIAEDIGEEYAKVINIHLDRLNFGNVLKRSLMLERLLGGCLTFLGVEGNEDDPEKEFHPRQGAALRFCNAIPISRIARMSWDTNPLSEHYMRPNTYTINGSHVHVSRCLVWDGEPLFDPYDFALTNFRGNLQGFGPSKLAPIWDDIVKAVGTRQAAYQLIQTNNAILIAINDLQDLQGTKSGQEALRKVKQIANQLSVYNAAMIDGDKVDVKQHSASFGSVPELIMTFIQILSAASDIPATRFLGQAPGGLNATGESDLENYYNVIDAYQRQRIEPQLRRVYDIIGYNKFPSEWKKLREKLTFKFPPLWNLSELEEADRSTKIIDNALKLRDGGLMDDLKVIQEINAKGALSVNLDETDIDTLGGVGDIGEGTFGQDTPSSRQEQPNPKQEVARLREFGQVPKEFEQVENSDKKLPPRDPETGEFVSVYHGGHISASESVLKEGIKRPGKGKDSETVSVAIRPDTAYGYAAMSGHGGESGWSEKAKPGQRPKPTSPEERQVYRIDVPKEWHEKNLAQKLYEGTPMEEYRYKADIPPEFIKKSDRFGNSLHLDRLPEPSRRQVAAGNYKKHHMKLHGLDISIENPKGSVRKGQGPDGTPWESILPAHYGYVRRTEGADGDHVDLYIGPHESSEEIYVVDQLNADTGEFDEHKCIFGALGLTQAKELYLAGFGDGKAHQRLGQITPATVEEFKQWLKEGDTKKPFANRVE